MDDRRRVAAAEDPVCAMTVDPVASVANGLVLEHDRVRYVFCSPDCQLTFRDDPAWFLDPAYTPRPMERTPGG
jgi:YHS domain-containing protein